MKEPHFTMVLRLDPDVEAMDLMDRMDATPGVKVTATAWHDAMSDRDALALVLESQDLRLRRYRKALERLRDCDWVISLPDRMDAVRQIAREALDV